MNCDIPVNGQWYRRRDTRTDRCCFSKSEAWDEYVAMTVSATIKPIRPENIDSFHRALDEVACERKYLTFLHAPPLEDTREFVLKSLQQGNPHLVALAGDQVVGWCDIQRHHFPAHAHRGTLGMGVIAPFRGQGLGLQLIESAKEQAKEAGISRIEFNVRADNQRAIGLYRKTGFAEEGVLRDAIFVDGAFFDAIGMAFLHPHHTDPGESG